MVGRKPSEAAARGRYTEDLRISDAGSARIDRKTRAKGVMTPKKFLQSGDGPSIVTPEIL